MASGNHVRCQSVRVFLALRHNLDQEDSTMAKCTPPHLGDSEERENHAFQDMLIPFSLDGEPQALCRANLLSGATAGGSTAAILSSDPRALAQVAERLPAANAQPCPQAG